MTRYQGFATKEEALAYQKEHGGRLCHAEKYSRTKQDYLFAVHLGGLNQEKYPYCLQWSIPKGKNEI